MQNISLFALRFVPFTNVKQKLEKFRYFLPSPDHASIVRYTSFIKTFKYFFFLLSLSKVRFALLFVSLSFLREFLSPSTISRRVIFKNDFKHSDLSHLSEIIFLAIFSSYIWTNMFGIGWTRLKLKYLKIR